MTDTLESVPADTDTFHGDSWSAAEPREEGYVALRSYGAIGDGRTVALVARDGQIDWLPMPSLYSDPVFSGIVDARSGGRIELRPVDDDFEVQRAYVPGTNVLRTRFRTSAGIVEVTDALVTGVAGRLPWSELARRVDGVEGSVDMRWAVVPGNAFGTHPIRRIDTVHGPVLRAADIVLALVGFEHGRTDPTEPGDREGGPLEFRGAFTTTEGSRSLICLCGVDDEPLHLPDPHIVDEGIDRTIENWEGWSTEFSWDGPWSDAVHRSALALKLLIFSPTGAIAAAATTALPENLTGDKNWDYRFAWVRDLAYTVNALIRFGLREEPHAAVSWMLRALKENGRAMHIFLRLDGSVPDGTHETRSEGWRGIGPVYKGNPAGEQLQLGVFADILAVASQYAHGGNILDESTQDLLAGFADDACRRWQEKDSGMWELPDEQHYVSSKMGCWQAITSALELTELGQMHPSDDDKAHWEKNRDLIVEWIDEHGWSEERGAYLMHPDTDALDASVLLHAPSGFDRGDRMSRTVDAIRDELGAGPLVFRYSGVDAEEGTFVACAFWLAGALACVGRVDEAVDLMDQLVVQSNDVGLFTEMISADDGQFLGNMPQGLSHLALVNAAITIDEMRTELGMQPDDHSHDHPRADRPGTDRQEDR